MRPGMRTNSATRAAASGYRRRHRSPAAAIAMILGVGVYIIGARGYGAASFVAQENNLHARVQS